MAIEDKLAITTCFDLTQDPEKFEITDDTNYSSEGIALTDVVGVFKEIKDPSGNVVYTNTDFNNPDIDLDSSRTDNSVSIPKDSDGNIVAGQYYSITYRIKVTGGTQDGEYEITEKYEYDYEAPDVVVDYTVDCECSTLKSSDQTKYDNNDRIDSTSLNRTHTVVPPAGSGQSNTVSSQANVTVGPNIYTGPYQMTISTTATYTFSDGLCIKDDIDGSDHVDVKCDLSLCDIFCCIENVMNKKDRADKFNPTEAHRIKNNQLDPIINNMVAYRYARECGKTDTANKIYEEILDIGDCTKGCGCDDDVPQQVIPFCGPDSSTNSITEVEVCSENDALELTSSSTGDTTTYTLCFKQEYYDKIQNLYNTDITGGTNIQVSVSTDASGNKTYTINATDVNIDMLTFMVEFDWTTTSELPNLNVLKATSYGAFNSPPSLSLVNGGSVSDFEGKNLCINVSGYGITEDDGQIKVHTDIAEGIVRESEAVTDCETPIPFAPQVYKIGNSDFNFRLVDRDLFPVKPNGSDYFNKFSKLFFSITVTL